MDDNESVLISKEPCPACGSRDNLARYSDGHAYCFGMSCDYYEPPTDGEHQHSTRSRNERMSDLIDGEYRSLIKRGIHEDTCRRYGYQVGTFNGQTVQIANYRDDLGQITGQKLRFADKDEGMPWLGDGREPPLFGQWLPVKATRRVVVTEGEIDALSISQATGNKWPVVSIPLGCKDARKAFLRSREWLNQFDEVVICFDMDEVGQEAAEECARVVTPGKASLVSLPLKDANEMLTAKRADELVNATFSAKPYRPSGLVSFSDIKEDMKKPVEMGLPWFLPSLTKMTYGRRTGEIYFLGAGTGIGKTDLLTQQINFDAVDLNEPVGLFFYEQQPQETGKRLAGKHAGKRFHIPNDPEGEPEWTPEELTEAIEALDTRGNITFFDSFGATDWDLTKDTIRFLAHSNNTKIFYIDHLTALAAAEEDERKGLERITAEMGSLVKELDIILIVVSHLATPEGKPHEEGGRVMIRHFKGSRAIGFWGHYMFGLERDQQHENPEMRSISTLRVLKDRYTGNATGQVIYLGYDRDTGKLFETELPESEAEGSGYGFTPQEDPDDIPF